MTDEDFKTRVDARLTYVESELMAMKINDARAEVHHQNVDSRLKGIEATLTWLVRLVIGAVLLAAIGVLMGGSPV